MAFAKPLDSYNYALLHNEAMKNDGLTPVYTDNDLQGYQSQSDAYKYPNVNWRDEILKPSARFDRYTFSTTGGNNFSKYFVSLDHVNQTGLLKESALNKYNTNNDFKAYTVRSNIDLNLNSFLSGGIYALGRILTANDAGSGTTSIYAGVVNTPSNAYPAMNPNGSFGGNQQFQNNLMAQSIGSGYRQNFKRDMLADFYLKGKLDNLIKGLWVKGMGSYYATLSEDINRSKSFAVFQRAVSPTNIQPLAVSNCLLYT